MTYDNMKYAVYYVLKWNTMDKAETEASKHILIDIEYELKIDFRTVVFQETVFYDEVL